MNERLVKIQKASVYCGVSIPTFKKNFAIQPIILPHSNTILYDINDIDSYIEKMKNGETYSDDYYLKGV